MIPPHSDPTKMIPRYFLVFLRIVAPAILPKSPNEIQNTPIREQSRDSYPKGVINKLIVAKNAFIVPNNSVKKAKRSK